MSNSATPWTVAHQAPLSLGFPRQEYWSGLPFPYPGNLLNSRIEPVSPAWQVDSLPLNHQGRSNLTSAMNTLGFPVAQLVKILPAMQETWVKTFFLTCASLSIASLLCSSYTNVLYIIRYSFTFSFLILILLLIFTCMTELAPLIQV